MEKFEGRVFDSRCEKRSILFFIGLITVICFGIFASQTPRQIFYGVVFTSLGLLVVFCPPRLKINKWIYGSSIAIIFSSCLTLLPRNFVIKQTWREELENIGLDTGFLITPNPVITIEYILIISLVLLTAVCASGHFIRGRNIFFMSFLISTLIALYSAVSIWLYNSKVEWIINPNSEFGIFPNRNHTATLLVIGMVLGCALLYQSIINKIWSFGLVIVVAQGFIVWGLLGYSISRFGISMAMVSILSWYVLIGKKFRVRKFDISFIVLLTLSVALLLFSDSPINERLKSLTSDNNNALSFFSIRRDIQLDTLSMIEAEPWMGTGLGTFEFIFPYYKSNSLSSAYISQSTVLHPESSWVDLYAEAGFLTMSILLTVVTILIIKSIKLNRKSRIWPLRLAIIISVCTVFIHCFVCVPGQKIGIVLLVIFLLFINYKRDQKTVLLNTRVEEALIRIFGIKFTAFGVFLFYCFFSNSTIFKSSKEITSDLQKETSNFIMNLNRDDNLDALKKIERKFNSVIKRQPLNATNHHMKAVFLGKFNGYDDEVDNCFKIERQIDSSWWGIPLRQANTFLFTDIRKTQDLWNQALRRASNLSNDVRHYQKVVFRKILSKAQLHPFHKENVYKMILDLDDPKLIIEWMNIAEKKNILKESKNIFSHSKLSDYSKTQLKEYLLKNFSDIYKDLKY